MMSICSDIKSLRSLLSSFQVLHVDPTEGLTLKMCTILVPEIFPRTRRLLVRETAQSTPLQEVLVSLQLRLNLGAQMLFRAPVPRRIMGVASAGRRERPLPRARHVRRLDVVGRGGGVGGEVDFPSLGFRQLHFSGDAVENRERNAHGYARF